MTVLIFARIYQGISEFQSSDSLDPDVEVNSDALLKERGSQQVDQEWAARLASGHGSRIVWGQLQEHRPQHLRRIASVTADFGPPPPTPENLLKFAPGQFA